MLSRIEQRRRLTQLQRKRGRRQRRAARYFRSARHIAIAGFLQKLLDDALRILVIMLAEMVMTDAALCVDEIGRRPIFVAEGSPDCIGVVDRDGIVDFSRATALRTLPTSLSKGSSGVCTPTTTRP